MDYDIDKQIKNYPVLVFNNISLSTFCEKILYYYLALLRSLLLSSSISGIEQI